MYNKHKRLVFIGAGGHAKVCFEIAKLMGLWDEFLFLDDNQKNDDFFIQGPISSFTKYTNNSDFFVSVGSNIFRKNMFETLKSMDCSIPTLIHPSIILGDKVTIGFGNVIMAGVIINSATSIGSGAILNTGTIIEHDCKIGDYVHLSPRTTLCGTVTVGNETWIGSGTTVINNISISSNVIIGAGSVVVENISGSGKYFGVPAKKK